MSNLDILTLTELLERVARQEESREPFILHYDCSAQDLRAWLWPVSTCGARITPSDLGEYSATGFRLPCCLCAVPDLEGNSAGYTESIVYMSFSAQNFGDFMIGCAEDTCGYTVCVERTYSTPGLPTKWYDRRPRDLTDQTIQRDEKESKAVIRIEKRAPLEYETPLVKLLRLDSVSQPGLSSTEFRGLFVRCSRCGWFMTRRSFKHHKCAAISVIDLTSEDDISN